MNPTNNKIAQQSKTWFIEALFELMRKYSYEAITISQLCRKADLSRKTFYRLFHTKEDVINEKLHLLALEFIDSLPKDVPLSYMDMTLSYFEFSYAHKEYLLILKRCNLLHIIFAKVQDVFPEICSHLLRTDNEICQSPLLPFIDAFSFGGLNAILLEWIAHDMTQTPTELIQAMQLFFSSSFK